MREHSCKELASELGLSNVAMYKIVDDFIGAGIVVPSEPSSVNNLGRKAAIYSLNKAFGLFAAVDFTGLAVLCVLHDIYGRVLAEIPVARPERMSPPDLLPVVSALRGLLARECCGGLPLRNVCICTPGRIDPATGFFTVAAIFRDYQSINLGALFSEAFGCNVIVKNNMTIAMAGELSQDSLKNTENAIYIYLSDSIGGALLLNGSIWEGDRHFAGEIGSTLTYDDHYISHRLGKEAVEKRYRALLPESAPVPREVNGKRAQPGFFDICALYRSGDPTAVQILDRAAADIAALINNLQTIIDCGTVIVNTDYRMAGDAFKKEVTRRLKESSSLLPPARLIFSPLSERVFIAGCIHYAVDHYVLNLLKNTPPVSVS
jgi:glucokinase